LTFQILQNDEILRFATNDNILQLTELVNVE